MHLENIPHEIKILRHWILWQKLERGGKMTKIPFQPNGLKAESDNPETWVSFDEAVDALSGFDGIGIMFANGLAGVDIDHCLENGELSAFSRHVINNLNSYTEYSPSGDGVHILFWGELPTGRRKHTESGLEMYDTGRYFTVTGNRVEDTPARVEDRTLQITALHKEIFGEPKPEKEQAAPCLNTLDDTRLIDMAMTARNGDKFNRLYNGNLEDYGSQSEADLAMCSMLAFWTGGDPNRIDRMFRVSGLMRDKWDEKRGAKTYGELTIDTALSGVKEYYQVGIEPIYSDEPRILTTYADLKNIIGPIEWSWKQWVAKGFLTVVAAESGIGKSAILMWLTKTYTQGLPWPDGTPYTGKTGRVLWCEAEGAQALNLDRAEKWGIPLDKLVFPLNDATADFRLDNIKHKYALAEVAMRPDIVAVIIDSLSGADNRAERSTEDTTNIFWLASLARDSQNDFFISHHLRKRGIWDGDSITLDRVRGASAIIQPARLVWAVDTPDRNNQDRKRVQVIKSNLAKFPQPYGMFIDDSGITFGEAPQAPKTETQLDKAIDLLEALLSGGPMKSSDLEQEFIQAGISWRTAGSAKEKLHVIAKKKADGWYWNLPDREDAK